MKKMNKKGFTLIEMLVVIAIIAILVAIVIPTVNNATTKAKEATDIANIRSTVAQYQIDNMNGTATWTDPVLKFGEKFTAPTAANGMTVKYVASTLTDGNDPADSTHHTYVWKLGDLVTETTTATTAPTTGN